MCVYHPFQLAFGDFALSLSGERDFDLEGEGERDLDLRGE